MADRIIQAKKDGFRRCGVAHTEAPKRWPEFAFTDEEWARLDADPNLVVTVAPDGDDTPPGAADQGEIDPQMPFEGRLKAAIAGLDASGFGTQGAPKLDALRAKMAPTERESVTQEVRDKVFAEMLQAGFEAPTAPAR